jgi:hypothetical protein
MTANQYAFRAWFIVCVGLVRPHAFSQDASLSTNHGATTNLLKIQTSIQTDDKQTSGDLRFTTETYEKEAFRLVLQEANKAAQELHLPEKLPIAASDVVEKFIVGYGMSQVTPKIIGNIHTRDYGYFVAIDHKLSFIMRAHQDQECMKWRKDNRLPLRRMNTNVPYQLATQWLAAASMDVKALNRDCSLLVRPNPYWNAALSGTGTFVPIYDVAWLSPQNRAEGYGCVATVRLFSPSKTLIDLSVYDSKYILRAPLQFTNLPSLLTEQKN